MSHPGGPGPGPGPYGPGQPGQPGVIGQPGQAGPAFAPGPPPPAAGGRRPWLWAFLAFLVLSLVIGGGLIAAFGGEERRPQARAVEGTTIPTTPATGDAGRGGAVGGVDHSRVLLRGLKQTGPTLGEAPISIVEFVDFQCPYCAQHQIEEQPAAIQALVRSGRVQLTMLPLAFLGPDSRRARSIYLKLSERGLGWQFADLFFRNQGQENSGYVNREYLEKLLAQIPGTTAADADPTHNAFSRRWSRDIDAIAQTGAVTGTPSFAVGLTGQRIGDFQAVGADWPAALATVRAIEQARQGGQGTSPSAPGTSPAQPGTPAPGAPRDSPAPGGERPSGAVTT